MNFKGKAIYNPSGKAREYSAWACNFYVGCSNGCTYCYCKKGILAGVMGQNKPQLKACFKNEDHALEVFEKELNQNLYELQKHGLFFSFTTDPMLPKTVGLTIKASGLATVMKIPVKILTKYTEFADWFVNWSKINALTDKEFWAFGFTLTGHDELEPGASTNSERIEAMKKLHDAGFKTFASIEPIIDFDSSLEMIEKTLSFCDHYKIGLESGKKYKPQDVRNFFWVVLKLFYNENKKRNVTMYLKDSIRKVLNKTSFEDKFCVNRDFNIFNNL